MEIKIEKGIPMPVGHGQSKSEVLRNMEVGDSFLMEKKDRINYCSTFARFKPKKFATRKEGDFIRLWRVI